jgi:hypothetical protein
MRRLGGRHRSGSTSDMPAIAWFRRRRTRMGFPRSRCRCRRPSRADLR